MKAHKQTRRSFMQLIAGGAAAVTGRGAAQAVKASGMPVAGLMSASEVVPGPPVDTRTYLLQKIKVLPDFKLEEIRRESKHVGHIDADIAVNVSTSLAAKVRRQRTRNIKNSIDHYYRRFRGDKVREAFLKKYKLDWF